MMEVQDWLLSYNRPGMPRSLRCGLATSGHLVVRRAKTSKLYFYAPLCVLIGVARSLVQTAGKESSTPLATVSHVTESSDTVLHYVDVLLVMTCIDCDRPI